MQKLIKDPFTATSITRFLQKFERTYSLYDAPGKGRKSLEDDREEKVKEAVSVTQSSSSLMLSRCSADAANSGISKSLVHRIMRGALGLSPWPLSHHQAISEIDKGKRLSFAHWILENESLLSNLIWSDEAIFSIFIS